MGEIRLARVHDADAPGGVPRFLVERLWPRGVRRDGLALDGWLKDVAPSPGLRKWFGHDPARWDEFRRRYAEELEAVPEAWHPLLEASRDGDVVLLFSSRDREHNNAVALREFLESRR